MSDSEDTNVAYLENSYEEGQEVGTGPWREKHDLPSLAMTYVACALLLLAGAVVAGAIYLAGSWLESNSQQSPFVELFETPETHPPDG